MISDEVDELGRKFGWPVQLAGGKARAKNKNIREILLHWIGSLSRVKSVNYFPVLQVVQSPDAIFLEVMSAPAPNIRLVPSQKFRFTLPSMPAW